MLAGEDLDQVQTRAIPAPNNDNLFAIIEQWAKQLDMAPEIAQSALYFLHLPKHSPLRQQLHARAQVAYPAQTIPANIGELRNQVI